MTPAPEIVLVLETTDDEDEEGEYDLPRVSPRDQNISPYHPPATVTSR
ncbi:MAG: hypothetical protein ABIF82_13250 [Planctomycetota bacterium]